MDIPASNWNSTDSGNTTAAPDGAPEGMSPSGVNDVLRAHQGAVKRWYKWSTPATTGGTSTAYTITYDVAPGALVDGMTHLVQFNATNGAAATLNINSLGAKPLYTYQNGAWAAAPAGVITADTQTPVSYDSSSGAYRIQKVQSSGTWTPTDASGAGLTFSNVSAKYQVIGNMVYAYFKLTYPSTANSAGAGLGGLPLTVPNQTYAAIPALIQFNTGSGAHFLVPTVNTTTSAFINLTTGLGLVNSNMSTLSPAGCLIYPAS